MHDSPKIFYYCYTFDSHSLYLKYIQSFEIMNLRMHPLIADRDHIIPEAMPFYSLFFICLSRFINSNSSKLRIYPCGMVA